MCHVSLVPGPGKEASVACRVLAWYEANRVRVALIFLMHAPCTTLFDLAFILYSSSYLPPSLLQLSRLIYNNYYGVYASSKG